MITVFTEAKSTECETAEPSQRRRQAATHEWTGNNPQNLKEVLDGWMPLHPPEKAKKTLLTSVFAFFGADYGARTRHLHLGKVALYQMS